MMSRRMSTYLMTVLVVCLALAAYGCMAGYRSSTTNGHEKVYRVDEDGSKTLVYEIAKDGTVTIHDESDPRAQQLMVAKANVEKSEAADKARIQRIRAAQKRRPDDEIRVAFYKIELGPNLEKAQHSEGAVEAEVLKNLDDDPVIRRVSAEEMGNREWVEAMRAYSGKSAKEAPPADVNVVSKAYLKERYGISKSTGKPARAVYVVFEATITCNYIPASYKVTEEGSMFRNADVTRNFVHKIKKVIKNEIGPTLPADRSL